MSHPLYVVDVFAEERYTGNQLAVIGDASDLTDDEMGRIAAEMNYSETTFIESTTPTADGYPVRIFTPNTELPFAGHPTLGTAFVLREVLGDGLDGTESTSDDGSFAEESGGERENGNRGDADGPAIPLALGVGRVPVTVEEAGDGERFWMRQPTPAFDERVDRSLAAGTASLDPDDLDDRFAPRVVSTGLPTLIVPVESLAVLRRARTDPATYDELLARTDAENVLVVAPETIHSENDLHVRVFAEVHGVPEDPATGSSNGCLAAYLARERYFDSPTVDVRVEQGYELDRPSLLCLRARDRSDGSEAATSRVDAPNPTASENASDGDEANDAGAGTVDVRVGGRVIPVAEGRLL